MNSIVIELCAEDRARLDKILKALENAAPRCDNCLRLVADLSKPSPAEPDVGIIDPNVAQALGAPEAPAPAPVRAAVPEAPAPVAAPVISLAEFQKVIVTRCAESPDTKKKVQALIANYADCVSNVPEERRAEFLEELAKI